MDVKLLHYTPMEVCDLAISKSHGTEPRKGPKMTERIHRVGVALGHESVLEHLVYTFDIEGISRACLQELARHRITSMTVKSTRYTLKELAEAGEWELDRFLVLSGDQWVDTAARSALRKVRGFVRDGIKNDVAKYALPESYKTSLVWTINARSLRNFLRLRTSRAALLEIRRLAFKIYKEIPHEHRFIFADCVFGDADYQAE